MYNVTQVPTYSTRKEARTGALSLSSMDTNGGEWKAVKVAGEWVALPKEYIQGTEDLGDTLPDTLEALQEDVTAFLLATEDTEDTEEEDTEEEDTEEATEEATEEEVPGLTEEEVQGIRTRLEALREEVRELEGMLASSQVHILVTSTVQSPVALVRDIFLSFVTEEDGPGRRKDVVNKAIKAGVAPNTAKTQYQVNRKKLENGDPALLEELEALRSQLVGE